MNRTGRSFGVMAGYGKFSIAPTGGHLTRPMKYLRRLKNECNLLQERTRELTPEQRNRLAALNNAIGLVTLARQVESQTDHWKDLSETAWTAYHAALEEWLKEHPSPPNSEH